MALASLQEMHKALEDEMVWRHNRFLLEPLATGHDMIQSGHPRANQVLDRVRVVQGKWVTSKVREDFKNISLLLFGYFRTLVKISSQPCFCPTNIISRTRLSLSRAM